MPDSKDDLKKFGLTMGIVLALIAAVLFWRGRPSAVYWCGTALFLAAAGVCCPSSLKAPHKAWMALALVMGAVMSRVILTVLFFAALTPVALLLKATGRDLLDRRPRADAGSFWKERAPRGPGDDERQF